MDIKEVVKEKYGQAALRVHTGGSSCCGSAASSQCGADPITHNLYAAGETGALPAQLRAELPEAEQLLVVARRVHNDAVRDTLGLRSLRLVRWLRLAGSAPLPEFFEIDDSLVAPDAAAGGTDMPHLTGDMPRAAPAA